jgi:hypothetical protein
VLQWAYNANSGDTGGLVDETWWNLMWVKLRFLRKEMGLTHWYLQDSSKGASWWSTAAAVNKPKAKAKTKTKTTVAPKRVTTPPAAKPKVTPVRAASKPKKVPAVARKVGTSKKQT